MFARSRLPLPPLFNFFFVNIKTQNAEKIFPSIYLLTIFYAERNFFSFFLFFLFHYLELSLYAQRTHRELFYIFYFSSLRHTHTHFEIIFSFPGSFNKSPTRNIFRVYAFKVKFFFSFEITLLEFFEYFLHLIFFSLFYGNNFFLSSLFFHHNFSYTLMLLRLSLSQEISAFVYTQSTFGSR